MTSCQPKGKALTEKSPPMKPPGCTSASCQYCPSPCTPTAGCLPPMPSMVITGPPLLQLCGWSLPPPPFGLSLSVVLPPFVPHSGFLLKLVGFEVGWSGIPPTTESESCRHNNSAKKKRLPLAPRHRQAQWGWGGASRARASATETNPPPPPPHDLLRVAPTTSAAESPGARPGGLPVAPVYHHARGAARAPSQWCGLWAGDGCFSPKPQYTPLNENLTGTLHSG